MKKIDGILQRYLREQIGLEEQLFKVVDQQISEIDETEFADAIDVLTNTKQILEEHFIPLNEALDRLDQDPPTTQKTAKESNGNSAENSNGREQRKEKERKLVAMHLRDIYSNLNLITMGNTILYTTALALHCEEVALISLNHLKNLAPLVVRIGKLLPEVATRELLKEAADIDLTVAQIALKNTQAIWKAC